MDPKLPEEPKGTILMSGWDYPWELAPYMAHGTINGRKMDFDPKNVVHWLANALRQTYEVLGWEQWKKKVHRKGST